MAMASGKHQPRYTYIPLKRLLDNIYEYKLFHTKNLSHNDELSNVITQTVVSFIFFMM